MGRGKGRKEPDSKGALEELEKMVAQDKISQCEVFVRDNIELIRQAIARGYNATDLSEMMKGKKIPASPTAVNKAIEKYAPGLIQRKPKKGELDSELDNELGSTTATAEISTANPNTYEEGDYEEEDYEGEEAA